MANEALREYIRDVPDFPKAGIIFKDITTLLKRGDAYAQAVDAIAEGYSSTGVDLVLGIESRGFILAGALAYKWRCGFVPARKPGKLPSETFSEEYELEYGKDALEIHTDAVPRGSSVLIVDDLLATGGTARAAAQLVEKAGGSVAGFAFLIELAFLNGRRKIADYPVHALISYEKE